MENDRNTPATKGDIEDLEARIIEPVRDAHTEVLKAFYGFAESNRQRVSQLEGNFPHHPPQ
jgi:hypothetical protein